MLRGVSYLVIYQSNIIYFIIRISFAINCLVFSLSSFATQPFEGLLPPEKVGLLKKSEGYLLIDLNISGVGPSFEFVKVVTKKNQRYVNDKRLSFGKRKWSISLQDKSAGLYALKLPQGVYQITAVKAPYFNLPYRMSTYNNARWRFSVVKGQTSYIGQLFIDHERGEDSINIKMNNRFATDYQRIIEAASFFPTAPLRHGMGMRDDFSEELLNNAIALKPENSSCLSSNIC
jgi:hypothetical protein